MSKKKKQRGTLYSTDSRVVLLKPLNGNKFEPEELRQAVGGYPAKVVSTNRRNTVYVNEEGLFQTSPLLAKNPHSQAVVDVQRYKLGFFVGNILSTYRITDQEESEDVGRVTVSEALHEI